ncbi:MAG TPA: hypothetical protein PLC53_00270 [Bacilli bacterium]|nr:hypothetical protein [Bacilli bacterium]
MINKPLQINNKMYEIIDDVFYNERHYLMLMNELDETDTMFLRVSTSELFKLEKLDSEEELFEVMKEFYRQEKEELED